MPRPSGSWPRRGELPGPPDPDRGSASRSWPSAASVAPSRDPQRSELASYLVTVARIPKARGSRQPVDQAETSGSSRGWPAAAL